MTTVAVIGDSHFDERSRWDECLSVHHWIRDDIHERRVSAVVHTGDVYERPSSPRERLAAFDWFESLGVPSAVVRGNHDAMRDLWLLEQVGLCQVVEAAQVVELAGVAIQCMAWPDTALLHSYEGSPLEAQRAVLRGLAAQTSSHERVIFAGHVQVRSSRVAGNERLVGQALELGIEDLGLANAGAYALGHIHLAQTWDVATHRGSAPVFYPGCPYRRTFGEPDEKGYSLLHWRDGRWVHEWIRTPCRGMHLITARFDGESGTGTFDGVPAILGDDDVRIRYTCDASRAAEARAWFTSWARERCPQAKLEARTEATASVRAPAVASRRTVPDQLEAMWQADNVSQAQRKRMAAMLEGLG